MEKGDGGGRDLGERRELPGCAFMSAPFCIERAMQESLLEKSRAIQRVTNHYNQLRFFVKQADGLAFTQMLGPVWI